MVAAPATCNSAGGRPREANMGEDMTIKQKTDLRNIVRRLAGEALWTPEGERLIREELPGVAIEDVSEFLYSLEVFNDPRPEAAPKGRQQTEA